MFPHSPGAVNGEKNKEARAEPQDPVLASQQQGALKLVYRARERNLGWMRERGWWEQETLNLAYASGQMRD